MNNPPGWTALKRPVARLGDLPGGVIRFGWMRATGRLGSPPRCSLAGDSAVVELFCGAGQCGGDRWPGWEPAAAASQVSWPRGAAGGGWRGDELAGAQVQHVRAGRDLRCLVRHDGCGEQVPALGGGHRDGDERRDVVGQEVQGAGADLAGDRPGVEGVSADEDDVRHGHGVAAPPELDVGGIDDHAVQPVVILGVCGG